MTTTWVITTASDRIPLDGARHGETTFTVTNPGTRPDRAVFEVVPGEGADPSWFSVDEPQRRVPGSGSVSYLVKVALPADAPPGSYQVQGRVYSADSAPEEDSVLSGRLAVELAGVPAPVARRRPWWILVVAGLVVVVIAVVLGVVLSGPGKGGSGPSASAPPPGQAVPLDMTGQSLAQATTNLTAIGLKVGTVRHKQDAVPDKVLFQSVPGGRSVAKGTAVDLVVTANLAAAAFTAPAAGTVVPRARLVPPVTPVPVTPGGPSVAPTASAAAPAGDLLTWKDPDPFVRHWQVRVEQQVCLQNLFFFQPLQCVFVDAHSIVVDRPSYTPLVELLPVLTVSSVTMTSNGVVRCQVFPLDDFGNPGTVSGPVQFQVQ